MPTPPLTYIGFIQYDPRTGRWRQYDFRDHVNERQDYFGLGSDGTLRRQPALSSVPEGFDRFGRDQNVTNGGDTSFFGAGVRKGFDAVFRSGLVKPPNPFDSDPLAGDVNRGELVIDPKMLSAVRGYLSNEWGLDGPAITNDKALDVFAAAIQTQAGLNTDLGEKFNIEMYRHLVETRGMDPADFLALYSKSRGVSGEISVYTGNVNAGAPDQELDAGRGVAEDFAGDSGGADQGKPKVTRDSSPADRGIPSPSLTGTTKTPGIGGSLGAGGVNVPNQPGTGPGGVQITPDLLQEFINSDWHLPFNAMLNSFRDAGTASIFMNWLSQQGPRLLSEFEGNIAQQALNGETPTGEFSTFLARKGLLAGTGLVPGADAMTNSAFAEFSRPDTSGSGTGSSPGGSSGAGGSPAAAQAQAQATPPLQVTPPATVAPTGGATGGGTKQTKDYVAAILGI